MPDTRFPELGGAKRHATYFTGSGEQVAFELISATIKKIIADRIRKGEPPEEVARKAKETLKAATNFYKKHHYLMDLEMARAADEEKFKTDYPGMGAFDSDMLTKERMEKMLKNGVDEYELMELDRRATIRNHKLQLMTKIKREMPDNYNMFIERYVPELAKDDVATNAMYWENELSVPTTIKNIERAAQVYKTKSMIRRYSIDEGQPGAHVTAHFRRHMNDIDTALEQRKDAPGILNSDHFKDMLSNATNAIKVHEHRAARALDSLAGYTITDRHTGNTITTPTVLTPIVGKVIEKQYGYDPETARILAARPDVVNAMRFSMDEVNRAKKLLGAYFEDPENLDKPEIRKYIEEVLANVPSLANKQESATWAAKHAVDMREFFSRPDVYAKLPRDAKKEFDKKAYTPKFNPEEIAKKMGDYISQRREQERVGNPDQFIEHNDRLYKLEELDITEEERAKFQEEEQKLFREGRSPEELIRKTEKEFESRMANTPTSSQKPYTYEFIRSDGTVDPQKLLEDLRALSGMRKLGFTLDGKLVNVVTDSNGNEQRIPVNLPDLFTYVEDSKMFPPELQYKIKTTLSKYVDDIENMSTYKPEDYIKQYHQINPRNAKYIKDVLMKDVAKKEDFLNNIPQQLRGAFEKITTEWSEPIKQAPTQIKEPSTPPVKQVVPIEVQQPTKEPVPEPIQEKTPETVEQPDKPPEVSEKPSAPEPEKKDPRDRFKDTDGDI